MTLLLDACTFIWLCSAPEKLSSPAVRLLDEKAKERTVSLASVWEIVMKFQRGKLPLPPVHNDPFDRVIAADALRRNLRIVTPDFPFRAYGCEVEW